MITCYRCGNTEGFFITYDLIADGELNENFTFFDIVKTSAQDRGPNIVQCPKCWAYLMYGGIRRTGEDWWKADAGAEKIEKAKAKPQIDLSKLSPDVLKMLAQAIKENETK